MLFILPDKKMCLLLQSIELAGIMLHSLGKKRKMRWKRTDSMKSKCTQAGKFQELEDFRTRSEVKLLHFPNFSQDLSNSCAIHRKVLLSLM